MISIETAKALKGLEWKPKEVPEGIYFAPRLDQMLAEIEKRGYEYSLNTSTVGNKEYFILVSKRNYGFLINEAFRSNAPEEAAAQALLWILKEGE